MRMPAVHEPGIRHRTVCQRLFFATDGFSLCIYVEVLYPGNWTLCNPTFPTPRTLQRPVASAATLMQCAEQLLQRSTPPTEPVRLLGLSVFLLGGITPTACAW